MKASPFSSSSSSRTACQSIILACLIFFSFSSMASTQTQKFSIPHSTKKHDHLHSAAVICYQLQRIRHCPPFPQPPSTPSSSLDEIDPRYGVEKRLVPSGPNPLHNWKKTEHHHFHDKKVQFLVIFLVDEEEGGEEEENWSFYVIRLIFLKWFLYTKCKFF